MIYRIHPDVSHYKSFVISSKEARRRLGSDTLFHFDQTPRPYLNQWKGMTIEFASLARSNKLPVPDLMVRHGRLFVSSKAYKALVALLTDHGEFLPVSFEGGEGYFFNILSDAESHDGLNAALSTRDQHGDVQSVAFHEDRVRDMPVFRTEFDDYLGVYCTDEFKRVVEAEGLTGITLSQDLGQIFPPDDTAKSPVAH